MDSRGLFLQQILLLVLFDSASLPRRWLPKRERSEFKPLRHALNFEPAWRAEALEQTVPDTPAARKKMRKRDKHLLRGPQGSSTQNP